MEPISSLDIAIKSIPLALKAWPWLQGKLTNNYSLNRLLATVGLDSKGKDFKNLYNKALDKLEGNTHPDIFELFKSNREVRNALEDECQGKITEVDTLYLVRMQLDADSMYETVKGSIEQELRAMRIFIFSAILDRMTPAERVQHGLLQDIHEKVNEMHNWMSQQQSIGHSEEIRLRQEEFDEDISAITNLIEIKHLIAAIQLLRDFSKRKWGQLTSYQKYKITANLGLCHFELGERDEAANCFVRLPSFAETPVTFGLAALGFALKEECGEAEHYAQRALAQDPDDENAWASRLECVADDKSFEQLEVWIGKERMENNPMLAVTFAGIIKANYPEHYDRGIELIKTVLPKLTVNTIAWAECMELHGIMLASIVFDADKREEGQDQDMVERQLGEAVDCLSKAWEFYRQGDLHSSKWSVLANRGSVYRRLGKKDLASRDFFSSLHEQPHFFTFQQLIQLKMETGEDCQPLFDEMEKTLQLDDYQKEQVYAGRLHYHFGAKQYELFLQNVDKRPPVLSPDAEKYISNLHIRSLLEMGKYEKALQIALQSLASFPTDPNSNFLTALASYHLGDYPTAKKYIDIAIESAGDRMPHEFLNDLTALLYSMGYHNDSIALLQQSGIKDELSVLSLRLMSSLAQTGRVEEASEIAKPLLNMEQPDPMVAELVIESHEREGRFEDALYTANATTTHFPRAPLFYLKSLIAAFRLGRMDLVKELLANMPDQFDEPVNVLEILGRAIVTSDFNRENGIELGKEYCQIHQYLPGIDEQFLQFQEILRKEQKS